MIDTNKSEVAVERVVAGEIRDFLVAERPAGVPASFGIVAEHDHEPEERPYALVRAVISAQPHPKYAVLVVSLETRMRVDEQGSEAAPDSDTAVPGWHVDLAAVVERRWPVLAAALQARGLRLRKMTPAAGGDVEDGDRGRRMTKVWGMHVQSGF